MEQNKRLSDSDKKLGVTLISCQNCNMEFHTLHREDKYCTFCVMYEGYKNPTPNKKRRTR